MENTTDQTYQIYSGVVPPFSLVWAENARSQSVLLWHDYREYSSVEVTEEHVVRNMVLLTTPIQPGETISRDYQIRADQPGTRSLAPGHWQISKCFQYRRRIGGPKNEIDWTASFDVESA